MTRIRQFYDGGGVPIAVPTEPSEVVAAWRSQRERLRGWFADLDEDSWLGATRCSQWRVTELVQHLVSGAQFLGYTLHQAGKGEATRLLADFDPQETPGAAATMFRGLAPKELLDQLTAMDERVDKELDALGPEGWLATAEAPPGHVPVYVSVNHFLFDSWVHERDVMLPAGQTPVTDPHEAAAVTAYVVALAGAARPLNDEAPPDVELRLHATDIDRHLCVDRMAGMTRVAFCDVGGSPNTAATSVELVDVATGRTPADALAADPAARAYLGRFAAVLS